MTFLLAIFALFFILSPSYAADGDFSAEDLALQENCIFLDRNGRLLLFMPDAKGERRINIGSEDIPELIKNAFISIEDKRFYDHGGFDLIAIIRALKDNLLHGRIVSGASTISQQTVRLIYPGQRTFGNKITEIFRSARLEGMLGKDELLRQYLNRVPMGNNIVGVELASRVYFGKGLKELAPAEAAVLAALPKAPSLYNPYGRDRELLLKRKNKVLAAMSNEGFLTDKELTEALKYEIGFYERRSFPNFVPHLTGLLFRRDKTCRSKKQTTIDLNIQRAVEAILASHRGRLASRGGTQAASIVVHNPTMEVLAFAGSLAYSEQDKGYNNGAIALRSAGSTIKPFLYAIALEQGYTASSLLEDILRRYKTPLGDYSPDNFDRKEYGPVNLRTALGNSLNISAVRMLESLEISPVYELLKRLDLVNQGSEEGAEHYGLGLVIGNMEVSLEKLTAAYAMLANRGGYRPLRYTLDEEDAPGERIFSEETAYIISDILSDPSARILTFGGVREMDFPFRVSVKTGTSTKYRDGWAIGYTPEYTIGVWVGDFDGRPTAMVTGAWGAGPILQDIIYLLHGSSAPPAYPVPENVVASEVCGVSGMKPGPSCNYVSRELFIRGTEPKETCAFHGKERYFHELPASYAGWVYDKASRLPLGTYRLKGFPRELEEVFDTGQQDDDYLGDLPGIRVLSPERTPLEKTSDNIAGDNAPMSQAQTDIEQKSPKKVTIGTLHANEKQVGAVFGTLSIIYPLSEDRFLTDEGGRQSIRLESVSSAPLGYVDWFIDGKHYVRTGPPYSASWDLERGRHTLTAVGPDNVGDSIKITVE